MPYMERRTIFDNGDMKIDKYFSLRYGKKGNRGINISSTSEKQKEINRKLAEEQRGDLILNNFRADRDYWCTFTYPANRKPDSFEVACKSIAKFMAYLKRKFKNIKYTLCTDDNVYGTNPHHHVIFSWGGTTKEIEFLDADENKIKSVVPMTGDDLMKLWQKYNGFEAGTGGRVQKIYNLENGALIKYFNRRKVKKYNDKGEAIEFVEKKFTRSRNLKKPRVIKKIVSSNSWRRVPKARKGYEVDDNSVKNGFDILGFEKQQYILRKIC